MGRAVGPHPPPGLCTLKGSRRLGLCAKLLGSSGKADLGQEEPGRGTNDSLSHILQGKNPAVCVAFGAGHCCSLGSLCSQNKSTGPATHAQPRNAIDASLPSSHSAHGPALSLKTISSSKSRVRLPFEDARQPSSPIKASRHCMDLWTQYMFSGHVRRRSHSTVLYFYSEIWDPSHSFVRRVTSLGFPLEGTLGKYL